MTLELMELQYDLLKENEIVRIQAEIIAPRIGGYNARPYDIDLDLYEIPRSPEIKALWRWWMRVVISGLYSGQKAYDDLDNKVSDILGSNEQASSFSVVVRVVDEIKLEKISQEGHLVKLLLIKIIPNILLKFKYRWNMRVARIQDIDLTLPVTIRFSTPPTRRRLDMNSLNKELHKYFANTVMPKPAKKGREARVQIDSSSALRILFKNLNLKLNVSQSELDKAFDIYDKIVKLSNIPRIRLLLQPLRTEGEKSKLLGKLDEEVRRYLQRISEDLIMPERLVMEIVVTKNRDIPNEKLRFAIAVLLLSILLGSTGSITRRGLGSIFVKHVSVNSEYQSLLYEELKYVNEILNAESEQRLRRKLIEFIRHILELGKSVYKTNTKIRGMPNVPALIPETKYFKIDVIECHGDILKVLEKVGGAFLKNKWKKAVGIDLRSPGGKLHTWILGLPRRIVKEGKVKTGYYIEVKEKGEQIAKEGRRISAISFKLFETRNSKKYIILYGFLSKDWPIDKLVHRSTLYKKKKVKGELELYTLRRVYKPQEVDELDSERFLEEVYKTAFEIVVRILKDHNRVR